VKFELNGSFKTTTTVVYANNLRSFTYYSKRLTESLNRQNSESDHRGSVRLHPALGASFPKVLASEYDVQDASQSVPVHVLLDQVLFAPENLGDERMMATQRALPGKTVKSTELYLASLPDQRWWWSTPFRRGEGRASQPSCCTPALYL